MVALLFCPVKGNANYPPLSVSLLSAFLKKNNIDSTVFDMNKSFFIENEKLANQYSHFFAYPSIFSGYTNDENDIKNVDTIYNFSFLLSILYGCEKLSYEYNEVERDFVEQLKKDINKNAELIISKGFKYVGFSTYVSNIAYSCILSKKLKEIDPNIITFFGGSSTSYTPIREFLLEMNIGDYILVGEGENSIVKLITDLQNGRQLKYNTIFSQNIAPQKINENEIIAPLITDLDLLPYPDFSDFDLKYYSPKNKNYTILPIASSRGCINQCVYCSETQYFQRFRQKSVEKVVNEIKNGIEKYNAKSFFFHDSLINGNIRWLNKFCDRLIEEDLNIHWFSFASVQNLNYEILEKMKKSGCVSLTYGIEHISKKVLEKMNKRSSLGKANEILEASVKIGIMPTANIIYGLVGEEDEDFANLLYFVSLPQFRGKIYFTYRSFEVRVGSVISNKIIDDMQDIKIRRSNFSKFSERQRDIFSKIDIYWLPDSKYVHKLLLKLNVINKLIREQEGVLNTRQSIIKNYDTIPILKSLITVDSLPVLAQDEKIINIAKIGLTPIEMHIVSGAQRGQSLEDIAYEMYNIIIQNNAKSFDKSDIKNTINSSIIDKAISLTQKGILKWK